MIMCTNIQKLEELTEALITRDAEIKELHNALQIAIEGIARVDDQGKYTFLNEKYVEISGYSTIEELIGKHFTFTCHKKTHRYLKNQYLKLKEKTPITIVTEGLKKNGETFVKHISWVPIITNDNFSGHWCFMKDISDTYKNYKKYNVRKKENGK